MGKWLAISINWKKSICFASLSAVLCLATVSESNAAAPTVDMNDAQLCLQHFGRSERENGIPKQLLSAIAVTESGRWSDKTSAVVPWPWTINSQGQGYYFDSMHEAVSFAKKLQAKGIDSMDVGCMQVNLHHHPDAFANLLDAFDPEKNVAYGAKFLRSNYDDLKSWPEAIAAYHSRTAEYGHPYYANVRRNWQRVLNGGQFAVADGGAFPVTTPAMNTGRSYVSGVMISRPTADRSEADKAARDKADQLAERRKANSTFQISVKDDNGFRSIDESRKGRRIETKMPVSMAAAEDPHVIRADRASGRKSGSSPEVLVVRPSGSASRKEDKAAAPEKAVDVAMAAETPTEATSESFVSGRRSSASRTAPESLVMVSDSNGATEAKHVSTVKHGPNFIFN